MVNKCRPIVAVAVVAVVVRSAGTAPRWRHCTTRRVTELDLIGNDLSGSIPAELGNLTNLTDLYLRDNAGLPAPCPVHSPV